MKVEQLMHRDVKSCRAADTLNRAAQLMWDNDGGCVPVVDEDGHPVGMITDRDVCMAAYTQGGPLSALRVAGAMAHAPRTCRTADTVAEAEAIMRAGQVRRLPVVDGDGRLIGILSLNDIAREAVRETGTIRPEIRGDDVSMTLGTICAPRQSRELSAAA